MIFCDAPPVILFQYGDLALTTRAVPSILVVPIYLFGCLALCLRRRTLGWLDPVIALALAAGLVAFLMALGAAVPGAKGLPGWSLLAPFIVFMIGYGAWRLSGRRPVAGWPWPRFGLMATLVILLADIGVGLLTPVPEGRVWQLGGACLKDALLLGPPFLMAVYYWLLDCRSPMVFCSRKCVDIGRCRFGMDGKGACADNCAGDAPIS